LLTACTYILVLEVIDLHPSRLNQLLKGHMLQYENGYVFKTGRYI
jgi:hypothetical protein